MKYNFINKCTFFLFFFFISTAILSTTTLAEDAVRSGVCATTGATINILDASASDDDGCETQPDSQVITIHKISLCTSSPTAPTTSAIIDRSMCTEYFSNDAGAVATVVKGVANGVTGTITDVPSGTYTHALVEMGTSFTYTSTFTFTSAATDTDGNNASTTCVTKASSFTPQYNLSNVTNLAKSNITCVNQAAAPTTIVLSALDFDGTSTCKMALDYVGTNSTVPAFLVKSDGKLAPTSCNATSANSVDRVVGFLPIDIKWSQGAGQKIKIKYNNSRGALIDWTGTNSINKINISFFDFTMTSRTPKKRSFE
jgi:hypothetical protein